MIQTSAYVVGKKNTVGQEFICEKHKGVCMFRELEELCKRYLEKNEYCDKLQYLSKYDESMYKELLDSWIELICIVEDMKKEICPKIED